MRLFVRLALRNVFRNRVRTAVAILAIAAGCAALIVNGGVIYNIFRDLREDAIRGRLGHLQVYRHGYSEGHLREPGRYLISRGEVERVLALLRRDPRILRATRRRQMTGMIFSGDRYVAFVGIGVEPEDDAELSRHATLRAGEPLSSADPHGVLAGRGLAEKFDGTPGMLVTLMTNTEDGALNSVPAQLRGIFEGGLKEYDDWTLKLPLTALESLLRDDRTEQVVVLLRRTAEVPVVQRDIEELFHREGLDLETRSWDELALFYNQVVSLFNRELAVIKVIIATIVILGIGNTIGMSIVERRVELATLRALGLRPRVIGGLLLTESLLTGLFGAVLGVALGVVIARTVSAVGIPFPSPPGSTRPFTGGVDLVPGVVAFAFLLSVAASLLAGALPAWRAVRRPIAGALRQG